MTRLWPIWFALLELAACGTERTTAPDAPRVYYCRTPYFGAPCPDAAPACFTRYGRPCPDAGTDAP